MKQDNINMNRMRAQSRRPFSDQRQSKDNDSAAHFYGELRNVQENERAANLYGELKSVAVSPYEVCEVGKHSPSAAS